MFSVLLPVIVHVFSQVAYVYFIQSGHAVILLFPVSPYISEGSMWDFVFSQLCTFLGKHQIASGF